MVTERSSGRLADGFRTHFTTYLDDFGTTVIVTRTTETKDSMNRITDTSTSTSTVKASIQFVTKADLDHLNLGDVKIGDGMLFVQYDADIELEDEITYDSVQWRVTSQIEGEQVKGNIVFKGYILQKNAQS